MKRPVFYTFTSVLKIFRNNKIKKMNAIYLLAIFALQLDQHIDGQCVPNPCSNRKSK